MNTPLNAVAALVLALTGSAWAVPPQAPDAAPANPYNQGTTADGKTIIAPGTFGPFQGPTCEAGSADCSAAPADPAEEHSMLSPEAMAKLKAKTDADLKASIDQQMKDLSSSMETPLIDIGKQQEAEASAGTVSPEQKKMIADGTYQSVQVMSDGRTMATLPNGEILFESANHGSDTMPRQPQEILDDPKATPAMKAAAQKALDAAATAKADRAMFSGSGGGGGVMGINSVKTKAGTVSPTEAGSPETNPTTGGDTNPYADMTKIPRMIATGGDPSGAGPSGLSGPGGPGGAAPGGASSDEERARNEQTNNTGTSEAIATAVDAEKAASRFEYIHNREVELNNKGLNDLRLTLKSTSGPGDPNAGVGDGTVPRGTAFYGR